MHRECVVIKRKLALMIAALSLFAPALVALAVEPLPPVSAYIGAEGCKKCHEKKYVGWKKTFHSTVVQDVKANPKAVVADFTQPGIGFALEDVEYTIGGHWNQRYMKKIEGDYYILPKSWSISSQRWEPHNVWSWRKMPYSKFCEGCHATRYDPADGSHVEKTIGCESCHGPGKAHADAGGGEGNIVNPSKLGSVAMEMICASCHVRGKDNSGEYHFPVGFVPGRELADYYVPTKIQEGEKVADALLRIFREWWAKSGSETAECDVCGIYGDKQTKEPKTVTEYCFSCHKFEKTYSKHTNHPDKLDLQCADCHKKVTVELSEDTEDVHSVSYFLVHKKTCYDRDFTRACRDCHQSFTVDVIKAKIDSWEGRSSVHE